MPKISVITPAYNCSKYIYQSVLSILRQSYTDYEFIIINDGSSDDTAKIISSFSDKRIVFVNHKNNKGVAVRTNEAIDMAKGEYIAIHDGDDISLDFRFDIEIRILEENKDLFCVGGHAIIINDAGKEVGIWSHPPKDTIGCLKFFNKMKNPIINSSSMYRKSGFIELGGYTTDKNFYTVPDLDFWGRALASGFEFKNIQQPVICYRLNPTSVSRTKAKEMLNSHVVVLDRLRSKITNRIGEKNG